MFSLPGRFRTSLATAFFPILLIALTAVNCLAQGNGRASTGTGGNHMIQGKIFFPSGRRADGLIQVKLESLSSAAITAIADSSGSFTFLGLVPGNYTIVVDAGNQYEISREAITIDSDLRLSRSGIPLNSPQRRYTAMITLRPRRDTQTITKPGVINASLASVPEEARALYESAMNLIKTGAVQKAVDNLKSALALYPNFALALNELGVQYLKLGQAAKAIEPLRSASKLNPEAFTPKLNLGIALLETRQFAEAETQLRGALKITSTPTAHMYLGLTLARLKNSAEAEQQLKLAVELGKDQLPLAHYYLGGLYWQMGSYRQAADELETYLRLAPNAPEAERVRETIRQLRSKS
jgi:tetratricopeptide (TPR) repeat protein